MSGGSPRIVFVTGTSTGVGKTIVTAALASAALDRGERVAIVKPAQTGEEPGEGDLAEIRRLTGASEADLLTVEPYRFPSPLAPATAARVDGLPELDVDVVVRAVLDAAQRCSLVLVEGAGGALVHLTGAGGTLLDIAQRIQAIAGSAVPEPEVLVVASAGLGTLNHTALTLEALAHRGLACPGVAIGAWPVDPGLAERNNVDDLAALAGRPLVAMAPDGAARRTDFRRAAPTWVGSDFGGTWDSREWPEPA